MCASGGRAEIKPFFLSLNPWNKTKHFVHDPHYIKLQVYKQVPRWWYLCILVVAFAMAQATNYTGESGLPWWALIVFIIFAFFLCCFYATLAAILGFYQFSSGGTGFFQVRPSLWCRDGQGLTTIPLDLIDRCSARTLCLESLSPTCANLYFFCCRTGTEC